MSSAGMSRAQGGVLSTGDTIDDEEIITSNRSQNKRNDLFAEVSETEDTPNNADEGLVGEDNDPDAYFVEAVRARRINPKTGEEEFLIKWEKWPESTNTWEPKQNLQCPEKLKEFFESARAKRTRQSRRSSLNSTSSSQNGRPKRRGRQSTNGIGLRNDSRLLLEEDSNDSSLFTGENHKDKITPATEERPNSPLELKGFDRGLEIEEILGSLIGDDEELCFAIKWKDLSRLDLVPVTEIEDKAPRALCVWYRQRLYQNLKKADLPLS